MNKHFTVNLDGFKLQVERVTDAVRRSARGAREALPGRDRREGGHVMPTRSTVAIYSRGEVQRFFYRHCDGYPTVTGFDLVENMIATLRQNTGWNRRSLLYILASRLAESRDEYGNRNYKPTPDANTDAVWSYDILFDRGEARIMANAHQIFRALYSQDRGIPRFSIALLNIYEDMNADP